MTDQPNWTLTAQLVKGGKVVDALTEHYPTEEAARAALQAYRESTPSGYSYANCMLITPTGDTISL